MDESEHGAQIFQNEAFGNPLIAKLIKISDETPNAETQTSDFLCGWPVLQKQESRENSARPAKKSKSKDNTSPNSKEKKYASLSDDNKLSKTSETTATKRKKKRVKFHPKRLKEKDKVLLSHSDENPAKNTNLRHKELAISNIVLRFDSSDEDTVNKALLVPRFRADISDLSSERHFVEHSAAELMVKPKPKSASSIHSRKPVSITNWQSSTFTKNGENTGSSEVLLRTPKDVVAREVMSSVPSHGIHNLSLSEAKFANKPSRIWKVDAPLPPIEHRKKRPIGSITAISQGNLKAGVKSNSIMKLRRQVIPSAPVIVPQLSGSKVEVPLLPRTPDFLYRIT